MSNKDLAKRWFEEIWNRKNIGVIHEMLHPEGKGQTEGGTVIGPDQFEKELFGPLNGAFPDIGIKFDGIIEEGDDVVVRWIAEGTHSGALLGIQPSGKRVRFSGMTWLKFSHGKLVEGWDRWNLHGLLNLLQTGQASATSSWV
jgi:predicted ester cyclase